MALEEHLTIDERTDCTEKKVEPKWLYPGAVLENGATLEDGAIFFFLKMAPK